MKTQGSYNRGVHTVLEAAFLFFYFHLIETLVSSNSVQKFDIVALLLFGWLTVYCTVNETEPKLLEQ